MRTVTFLSGLALLTGLLTITHVNAQSDRYVKQIITGNSGKFEFTPPYTDYVTVQSFNPQTSAVNVFDTVYTQSVQSVIVTGGVAFLAAQDSIVKYNLNTMQRMASVSDSGLNQLALYNGKLVVSKQYPVTTFFVEVLDTSNLSIIAEVPGISGDCGGISIAGDTVYVAVNGGWMGTNGKLAIIDPVTWTLNAEVDFGHEAIGIFNLYNYQGKIFSVNRTPYGIVDTGSVTVYNPPDRSFSNVFLNHIIASGAGIQDSLLYLGIDYGIGSFNLNNHSIQDTMVVPDPGSSFFTYILSAAVDTLNGRIYSNIGNYVTPGYCLVTDMKGDSITSFSTGISSDALAVDYRNYPAGLQDSPAEEALIELFPNPVLNSFTLSLKRCPEINRLLITDITGSILMDQAIATSRGGSITVPCENLSPGLYYLILETAEGRIAKSFIKR